VLELHRLKSNTPQQREKGYLHSKSHILDMKPQELSEPSSLRNGTKGHVKTTDDDHAVLVLRNLLFDICNQNGGGHGGSAIGMAAIGVALFKYVMKYSPADPDWFDRDRFVLSNGV
jgi:hypothetical protein